MSLREHATPEEKAKHLEECFACAFHEFLQKWRTKNPAETALRAKVFAVGLMGAVDEDLMRQRHDLKEFRTEVMLSMSYELIRDVAVQRTLAEIDDVLGPFLQSLAATKQ